MLVISSQQCKLSEYQYRPDSYNLNIYTVGNEVLSSPGFASDQLLVTISLKGHAPIITCVSIWINVMIVYNATHKQQEKNSKSGNVAL